MIIRWIENCIKVIPRMDKDRVIVDHVVLAPGYTDIPDAEWAQARETAADDIKSGRISEEWVKAEKAKKKSKKAEGDITEDVLTSSPALEMDEDGVLTLEMDGVLFIPALLKDIPRPRIKDVIEDTQHPPTLKKWENEELRQDVRIYIMNQLKEINKTGE